VGRAAQQLIEEISFQGEPVAVPGLALGRMGFCDRRAQPVEPEPQQADLGRELVQQGRVGPLRVGEEFGPDLAVGNVVGLDDVRKGYRVRGPPSSHAARMLDGGGGGSCAGHETCDDVADLAIDVGAVFG
jgi:hypothetical protein